MLNDIIITESNGDRRKIGIYNDKTNEFITQRNGSKHLLRKYDAWAIDKKLVVDILAPKKALIIIQDIKSKKEYRIHANEFLDKATETTYYQHRSQLYLRRDMFEVLKMSV